MTVRTHTALWRASQRQPRGCAAVLPLRAHKWHGPAHRPAGGEQRKRHPSDSGQAVLTVEREAYIQLWQPPWTALISQAYRLLQACAKCQPNVPASSEHSVLIWCFGLAAGLAAEEAAVAASSAAATAALPRDGDLGDGGQPPAGAAHEYLLVEFALTLLHG